jgi:hypothetical protein
MSSLWLSSTASAADSMTAGAVKRKAVFRSDSMATKSSDTGFTGSADSAVKNESGHR